MKIAEQISLTNVSTNNLQGIDVHFPLNKLSVVTGVSGSGKSSLVFDTLYAESYRRFVDSLSSFARQYLKALPKPKVDSVGNLPPAISVRQGRVGSNQRSTVGTLTELTHLVQTLFTHLAGIVCYKCQRSVKKHHTSSILEELKSELGIGDSLSILAPLQSWVGLNGTALKTQIQAQGFVRVLLNSKVMNLEEVNPVEIHQTAVLIDRISFVDDQESRLREAIDLALKLGRGRCLIQTEQRSLAFSTDLECVNCGIRYLAASMVLFSFNHPLGACDQCHGYGRIAELDWDKIIPDKNSSIAQNGIAPFNFGSHAELYDSVKKSAKKNKIDIKKSFKDYTKDEWHWLREGSPEIFLGISAYFDWLDAQKYKAHYRIHSARFKSYKTCPGCNGSRYCREALVYQLNGKNIAEVQDLAVKDLQAWLQALRIGLQGSQQDRTGLTEAYEEIQSRIYYLLKVGLSYLSLSRTTGTLSGGELQRIHMASCIGSALTDTMYCLDEPTAGLHARDSQSLLDVIYELRDQGNSVIVVEHDRQIIQGADYVLEIGPGSGHLGGKITRSGADAVAVIPVNYPEKKSSQYSSWLKLEDVSTHNLQNVSVAFPLGALTVVCGVSGSGKTSLIQHTLVPILNATMEGRDAPDVKGKIGPKGILQKFDQALFIDQRGLSRSSRSNIATYLGVFDHIRSLFSRQPRAKELNLTTGSFSFNVPGGRCETCKGLGFVDEDLSFLGEVQVSCPQCQGKRFSPDVLSVTVRGKTLLDILQMTVHQAFDFFFDHNEIRQTLAPTLELGLGYLTLGQATSSFSGGEAQRLKLLSLLKETGIQRKPLLLVFDEPTTGLSDKDVYNLWKHLDFLTQKGHTIIVIEHHLDMIQHADWLIEVGPNAAEQGGQIVYQGPPKGVLSVPLSQTAPFLKF